jgi:hypothetical protein
MLANGDIPDCVITVKIGDAANAQVFDEDISADNGFFCVGINHYARDGSGRGLGLHEGRKKQKDE